MNSFFKYKFIYFNWRLITLQSCIGFAIHQHETATGVHVFPILNPTPTSTHFLSFIKVPLWRRQWHPTPVLLAGKSHGWRSLVGCSVVSDSSPPHFHFHFSLSCIGEGNGNPLQCSFLENPRDRGAWWASIYGVAQSRTRLMWLSSSRLLDIFTLHFCSIPLEHLDKNTGFRLLLSNYRTWLKCSHRKTLALNMCGI